MGKQGVFVAVCVLIRRKNRVKERIMFAVFLGFCKTSNSLKNDYRVSALFFLS